MASSFPISLSRPFFSLILLLSIFLTLRAQSQVDGMSLQLMREALDWPSTSSIYSLNDEDDGDLVFEDEESGMSRRSLYWSRHYYISYGALSANRIPCPPRSGRSYYTHNCYKRRDPVQPYVRGCSTITACKRDAY